MSARQKYYEDDDYSARLRRLNDNPRVSKGRDNALVSLLNGVPTGLDILDAGCGLGGFSQSLRSANRMTGVDLNPSCLREVEKFGYVTQQMDLEEPWPLAPESFDLILFGDVLEHLFATQDVLTSARRALRQNGHIAVAVPNVGYWRRRLRLLIKGELKRELDDHIRFFSPRTLARIAGNVELEVLRSRPYTWNRESAGILPLTLSWGFVSLLRAKSQKG
jgi:2-polyprenyl-3-methyl-5-hydroxy-6-metoxy-1,4-benzoquinol methylase